MSKPKNWNEMDREQQRAWTQQDAAREDAEYTAEQNQRRAEQAERNAESARRASMAARSEYEENAESYRSEIEELRETLTSVRVERDKLLAALKGMIEAVVKDSDEDDKGISGFTGARLSDAREAIEYAEKNPA